MREGKRKTKTYIYTGFGQQLSENQINMILEAPNREQEGHKPILFCPGQIMLESFSLLRTF